MEGVARITYIKIELSTKNETKTAIEKLPHGLAMGV